jgi:chromosome segregation ATPase
MKLRQGREDKREAELSELKTQHQDLMHVRKSMIADRDRLSAEVAAEMGRAAQAQQRLHAELDAAHSMRDELQRQAAELREELKEKSEALASANAQVQDKISEVAALAGSLQEQQMLKDRADSESKSALEALAKECAVAAAASKALESDKKELMWKTQAQEDKVADLKTLLEERRKDLDKCEGEKQEARLEAARLKAERDLQEGKLEETRAKLDAKEEQIKDAMKTVQQVQNMSLERSKEVAKERESQEREREALTRDMLQGKDDLVQAHRELDSLKKSLADLEAKGCSADDALGKSKVEVE